MAASISQASIDKFTTFGDFLRFLRRRAGITQLELSIAVGYSDAQISRLEQNLRLPDIPTIEARFVPALGLEDEPAVVTHLIDLAANLRREDAPVLGLCPYKGLNFFDEADADLFVGRENLTAKLLDRVLGLVSPTESDSARFLAVIGASGSGKSSLVRAGLVPALRWNPKTVNWPIHFLTPTVHPLESLALSLTHENGSVNIAARLMDDLEQDPRSLKLFIKKELQECGGEHSLLVIDQFEEVFALCRSEVERAAFINNLMTAASVDDGPVVAIITLRADFYAHCAGYDRLRDVLSRQQEYIGEMSAGELRRAIEEPARRGHWEIEPGLVDLLLHDVGSEPGALPLLSHALFETWHRRRGREMTMSGYAASGGVRGAIAETAEAVFTDQFTKEQQVIARRVFIRLTELGDENESIETRRRVTTSELIIRPEQAEATQKVLKALADARLITVGQDSVEVAHEALIREWPTLRTWLEENREGLRLHRHLTEAAQEWHNANRESELLYRGVKLMQAREWAGQNLDEMNPLERDFVVASVQRQEQETAERELQQQRELEAAHRLAEAETKRAEEQSNNARQLRKRSYFLAGALIITLILVATSLILAAQARQATASAQSQQRVAFSRELAAAAVTNLDVDPERSILLALEAVSATYSVDQTWTLESEDALRQGLQASRVELTLRGHTDLVSGAVFSPDGMRIATTSNDGTARIWNARTGAELLSLPTGVTNALHGIDFSPDGKLLATAGKNGTAILWDAATGEKKFDLMGHSDEVAGFDFSPDGKWLATSSEDRTVKIWDTATGKEKITLTGHFGEVWHVVFSPDGKQLATASNDGSARVWDAATGERLLTFSSDETTLYSVGYNSDGSRLITSGVNRLAQVWDAASGELLIELDGHIGAVSSAVFSPDDTLIATGSDDGSVIIWDAETGRQKLTFRGHTNVIFSVAFSQECLKNELIFSQTCGFRLVSASWDGTARVWSSAPDRELLTLAIPDIFRTIISPDGSLMAMGYDDGSIKIFNISTMLAEAFKGKSSDFLAVEEVHNFCCHSDKVNDLAFRPDGAILATASDDRTVKLWDVATGKELQTITGFPSGVEAVILNPNGAYAAARNIIGIIIFDLTQTPAREVVVIDARPGIEDFKFSPDGKQIAVGLSSGMAAVFDSQTGEKIFSARPQFGEVWSVAYSPDGTVFATAGGSDSISLWDAKTGIFSHSLKASSGTVGAVAFSPNGQEIAGTGLDQTTKIWNVTLGEEIATLTGHSDYIMDASFHSNCSDSSDPNCGTWLATKSIDGTFRFYLTQLDDLTALARARVTRPLSSSECMEFLHRPEADCPQDLPQHAGISPTSIPNPDALPSSSAEKVCQVTNTSGVNDQFFNQIAYSGVKKAADFFRWETSLIESASVADYAKNIQTFIDDQCSLIVVPMGFDMAEDVATAAKAYPQEKFVIMDATYDQSYANVWTEIYAIDQAGFLAGYVAAAVTKTGKVGTYGGYKMPPVADFMIGFALGVQYYNDRNDATVQVIGWDLEKQDGIFIDTFENQVAGRAVTKQLLDQGVDVILPVAGPYIGLGTAEVLVQRGEGLMIGVDTDWAVTYPEHAGVILTSIEKRMDNSVINAVRAIVEGNFTGGTHIGTLANGGVGLAPFHQLDSLVSAQVKADLEEIKAGIISSEIKTLP